MAESEKAVSQTFKHLLIRTVPDGFQFGRTTSNGDMVQKLKLYAAIDFPDLLEKHLRENNWLKRNDLKITLIDFAHRFMILPNEFANDESIEDLFNFQNGEEEEQQTYMAPLDDNKQTFCWQIPSVRDEHFEDMFANLTLLTSCYILANWSLNQAAESKLTLLTASFYGKHMQLFVATPDKLLFANSFIARDDEETCYFLLRCVDQLELDARTLTVCFCCEGDSFPKMKALFEPYLATIIEGEFTYQPEKPFRICPINSPTE